MSTTSNDIQALQQQAINLLKQLIQTPSLSGHEHDTAGLISNFLALNGVRAQRLHNNIWATNKYFNNALPTLLLNSHHDTVKPAKGYTINPFEAIDEDGKIYGLGSNDAGGSLVSLLAVFLFFYQAENLPYNIIFAATAEEEISGAKGIAALLPTLPLIALGIVGEPTEMQLAVSQKGLLVIDATALGTAQHVAHTQQFVDNAIINALHDIQQLQTFSFPILSPTLGKVTLNITQIEAGQQHNMIPDECKFTIDVRTTDCYTNQQVFEILQQQVKSKLQARSFRLQPSSIPVNHPLVQAGVSLGLKTYGSPTLSDGALMPFPVLKMGTGSSMRSHTANEFIYKHEIQNGISTYIQLLEKFFNYHDK